MKKTVRAFLARLSPRGSSSKVVSRVVVPSTMSTYTVQAGDTFSSIAAKLGTTVAALEQANPGISPTGLQVGQVLQLQPSGSTYAVQAGDTFSGIASKFGTTVAALEAANPSLDPNNLQIGAVILIPASTAPSPAPVPVPTPAPASVPVPSPTSTYTIKSGDTLDSIAAALGITVSALEAANPTVNPNNLQVGSHITIPSTATTTPAPIPTPVSTPPTETYTIQAGDTLTSIATKLGTTVAALEAANPGINPNNLQIGTQISLPSTSTAPTPTLTPVVPTPTPNPNPPASTSTYNIQAGDTFSTIAASFNVTLAAIEAANPGVNPGSLQVGEVINLPAGAVANPGTVASPGTGSGSFVAYSGPASNFPDPSLWATYTVLWAQNSALMSYNDSPSEIALIGQSIPIVAQESGIDPRVILCIIMQESGGNVRVGNTFNGVNNTGIMQAFNGVSFDSSNPSGSILQMIRDGTEGTASGPGLKQAYAQYGNYYIAFRIYNSGSVDLADLNDPKGATAAYVVDTANRLMGHTWAGM
jgi:LysM repeat protein